MFTGAISDDTRTVVLQAGMAIANEVVDELAPVSVSRVLVLPELILPRSKMIASLGVQADGSALMPWDASALLLHELKEILHGR